MKSILKYIFSKILFFNVVLLLFSNTLYASSAECECDHGVKYKHHRLFLKNRVSAEDFTKSLYKAHLEIVLPSSIAGMHDNKVGLYGGSSTCTNIINCRTHCVALCNSLSNAAKISANQNASICRFSFNGTQHLSHCDGLKNLGYGRVPAIP